MDNLARKPDRARTSGFIYPKPEAVYKHEQAVIQRQRASKNNYLQSINIDVLISGILIAFMCFMVVVACKDRYVAQMNLSAAQTELESLQIEEERIRMEIDKKYNLVEIEQQMICSARMIYPAPNQYYPLDIGTDDVKVFRTPSLVEKIAYKLQF